MSEIEGTLPAALVGNEGVRGPDLAMSFRWNSTPNDAGYRGHVYSTGGRPGQGQHGSMSKHELRNIMFSRGPSFKPGLQVDAPSGNVDLAPTVLRLLGIPVGEGMEGRVLEEALINGPDPADVDWSREMHNTERRLGHKVYRRQIAISRVGDTTYVDEGNSTFGWR